MNKIVLLLWIAFGICTALGQFLLWRSFGNIPNPPVVSAIFFVVQVSLAGLILRSIGLGAAPIVTCLVGLFLGQWWSFKNLFAFVIWSINGFAP